MMRKVKEYIISLEKHKIFSNCLRELREELMKVINSAKTKKAVKKERKAYEYLEKLR